MSNTAPTYAQIEKDAIGELNDYLDEEAAGADDGTIVSWISETAAEWTPSMTTVLFGLVVSENALAFEDSPSESGEPFHVLYNAVCARLERALIAHWESRKQ